MSWGVRKRPYTEEGLKRVGCVRCGAPASAQWQICSDGNNYRPLCTACDIALNALVLKWAKHPLANKLVERYGKH